MRPQGFVWTIWRTAPPPQLIEFVILVCLPEFSSLLSRLIRFGLAGLGALALTSTALAQVPLPADPASPDLRETVDGETSTTISNALAAARRGDVAATRTFLATLQDPTARKLVTWVLADSSASSLTIAELDQARRDLAGWPRDSRRQIALERRIREFGWSPDQVIANFSGAEPQTAEGSLALAEALRSKGENGKATALIRKIWTQRVFEAEPQRVILARFGDILTPEDHQARADLLLFGNQGPAAQAMIPLLDPVQQLLAQARIALRQNSASALSLVESLPSSVADSPALAFEKAAYYRKAGQDAEARALLPAFPTRVTSPEMATRIWDERYQLTISALRNRDDQAAYLAAANTGLTAGADATEAEFYAGWVALTRLHDPARAEEHFKKIDLISVSPITRARAMYWRGRAVEEMAGYEVADIFYSSAAQFKTTFYGQLAAEKLGLTELNLGTDPEITSADRQQFESRDTVKALRLLMKIGNRDLFRTLALQLDDLLPTTQEEAQLVDLVRAYGDQDTSMKVVRTAAQRGLVLPERGYPRREVPDAPNAPEAALVLAITRQESGFDPTVRSGVGARGMMQLMPTTAAAVARKNGTPFSTERLSDPDYNMQLGSSYLGGLVNSFSGSYVMAVAGYNAGPSRSNLWASFCGDPRAGGTDPVDYIECISFSETRNYVMRVLENLAVYRAHLNGGVAPLTLSADLRRGGYTYTGAVSAASAVSP